MLDWQRRVTLQLVTAVVAEMLLIGHASIDPSSKHALDFCPIDDFRIAARSFCWLESPDHLPEWSGRLEEVVDRYKTIAADRNCESPLATWPISKRRTPFIINAGEGTTGSRFLLCIMQKQGFRGAHPMREGPKPGKLDAENEFEGCSTYGSCTAGWDRFDFVTDSPVPYDLHHLLTTHPNAIVLHSIRDPRSWKRSRIGKHATGSTWRQAAVCAASEHIMDHPQTELDFVVYNAWAKCIAKRFAQSYFVIDLFTRREYKVVFDLLLFLHKHNLQNSFLIPKHWKGTITSFRELAVTIVDTCRAENGMRSLEPISDWTRQPDGLDAEFILKHGNFSVAASRIKYT